MDPERDRVPVHAGRSISETTPMATHPTLIIHNARIHTGVSRRPQAQALAVSDRHIAAVGTNGQIKALAGHATVVIDAGGRRLIPGLIDSHLQMIGGGLRYNLELRWDGVPSLAEAMRMLVDQVARTPASQWVRVIGGFSEHQFAERRLPTLDELNQAAPATPVLILHLQDRALLNAAALRACGYTRDSPDPLGGHIVRDHAGVPTGLLLETPSAAQLQATLALGPGLPHEYQLNATRHFMRALNRFGITSVLDAGGAYTHYPDDYRVIQELHHYRQLTVRIAYNLSAETPGKEYDDFAQCSTSLDYGSGDASLRFNGAGPILLCAADDLDNFRHPRPDTRLPADQLEQIVRWLAARRWPWRMHSTYDETIGQALDVFERVAGDMPLHELPWFFDHAETVSERNLERIARLGGGIAVQPRLAYQGEYFVQRYGSGAAARTLPLKRMLAMGLAVGAGSGANLLGSYDPWHALYWLATGRTLGGLSLYATDHCLDRTSALALYTQANTWFTGEEGLKGQIDTGQLADFAVLSQDYFTIPDEQLRDIVSELTVVDGQVVYADGDFRQYDPNPLPAMPEWSPVNFAMQASARSRPVQAAER
jgi:predicted amidohydrolase YtcJ